MSEWSGKPYPGGPALDLPGFPRPLHPPGSPGYVASVDGDDITGYKRIAWRLGRWQGPPDRWDDSYSRNFAFGMAGGNVSESGVRGLQRQQPNLEDTGYVGEKFWSFCRNVLIPAGLPNAGEYGMDETARQCLIRAFNRFHGHEPPPPAKPTVVRVAALNKAITQLGVKESPPESNRVKYSDWYGMVGPWCAMFVTWCYEIASDNASPAFVKSSRYAYCPYLVADARAGRYGMHTTDDPIPGDVVVYDWQYNGEYDHVGIFEGWKGGSEFTAIEGNTSMNSNSNGGEVMRRVRNTAGQATVFIRVDEP